MFGSGVRKKLKPFIDRYTRTAFKPILAPGHGAADGSRFNGTPFLVGGEPWPACQLCQKPMPLFLQLNLKQLPEPYDKKFGVGVLQLFYCVKDHDFSQTEDWAAFDHKTKLVRVVAPDAQGAIAAPRDVGLLAKPQSIVDWERFEEALNTEEAERYGLKTIWDRSNPLKVRTRFVCEALDIDTGFLSTADEKDVFDRILAPKFGDKLGGWPGWVQGVEYPSCTRCGVAMDLVFQIDSNDHVPFMFGDVGCGHITQCPDHKDVVTFAWACH